MPKNRCPKCGMGVVITKHIGINRHCTHHDGWCDIYGMTMKEALLKTTFSVERKPEPPAATR